MTGPALIDPQLSAFLDADPSRLSPPAPVAEKDRHRELELAIAAAALVVVKIVRDRLAARHQGVDTARDVVLWEWRLQMPVWLRLTMPAIMTAFRREDVGAGLTPAELEGIASTYAESLGEYVGESSADALQAGLAEQLNNHWDERLSWQRTVAGFGLDARDMRGYVKQLAAGILTSPARLISPAASSFIDRHLLTRLDRIGRGESWTAVQTGKALAWMYLQRSGQLPAEALREWDTAEDESTCSVCAPMDGGAVRLDEPFTIQGKSIWAPQAHPGCRCRVRLVVPEESLAKAWTPEESREHPTGQGHRFVRKPAKDRVQVAEAVKLDPVIAAARRRVAEEVEEVLLEPLPTLTALPTLAPLPTLQPLLAPLPTLQPILSTLPLPAEAGAADMRQEVRRRRKQKWNVVVVRQAPPKPRPRGDVYFTSVERYNRSARRPLFEPYNLNDDVDFSIAQRDFGPMGTIRANSAQPHFAIDTADLQDRHGLNRDAVTRDLLEQQWEVVVKAAVPLINDVLGIDEQTDTLDLRRPRGLIRNLAPSELFEIAQAGGFLDDGDEANFDGGEVERAILGDISLMPKGKDSGLGQAFLDHVIWEQPVLLGSESDQLVDAMEAANEHKIRIGGDGVSQTFSFDTSNARQSDIHPGAIVPTGDYQVYAVRYHSGLWDMRGDLRLRPLHIGSQELQMLPLDVRGGKWQT